MRRITSLIILVAFMFSQAAGAYGQQLSYPASVPNVELSQRVIKMNNNSNPVSNEKEREKAMIEAIFEAGYKEAEIEKKKERLKELKGPMKGRREKAIEERYRLEEEKKRYRLEQEKALDLRRRELVAQEELRKIRVKRVIPKGVDLGEGFVRKINEKIYPVKVSGEYQVAWGYDWGDRNNEGHKSVWKNADFNKANMVYVLDNQYVFGRDRENTYDKKVYDRFRLKIESLRETGLNFLSETVIDPWSFVGETDFLMINGANGQIPLKLRYWSNTQSTIDERIWLTNGVDFINIPEIKVNKGRTHATFVRSAINRISFIIPELDIDRDFRPLRKLEANYKNDRLNFKVFPFADQDHTYTSDDPLILSNNHIYWEPSPWLDRWDPAVYYPPTGDFRRGKWTNDISFDARDSDFNFLTLLRGLSWELNYEDTYVGGAVASPIHPWQFYDSVNSIPGAVRFKQNLFKDYYLGAVYACNYGFNEEHLDAFNHVIGVDAGYEMADFVTLRGEFARSIDRRDWRGHDVRIDKTIAEGNAFRIEAKGEFLKDRGGNSTLKVSSSYTHMGDGFRDRLSNYRNTRSDQYWGKHIRFEEVSPDFDAFRIGNGIDTGRNVHHMRIENMFYKDMFNSLFDMRFVRRDIGGKVENVYREEATFKPFANLTGKFLFRYQDLPRATNDVDPFIITDYISADNTDEFLANRDITGGEDPSVWTWSVGIHCNFTKWMAFEEIYERTNDHDIFPQLCLNDANFVDLGNIRELGYFLYSQPLLGVPPYDKYNIFKSRVYFTPLDSIRTKFEYVINTFKHATGRDDNISHYGVEIDVDFTKKLRGSFKFIRSQLVDLYAQQQDMLDLPFNHHDNIFAKVEYDYDEDVTFVAQFGEFFVPAELTPVSWLLNTVDTQKIVRFYLKGKF